MHGVRGVSGVLLLDHIKWMLYLFFFFSGKWEVVF